MGWPIAQHINDIEQRRADRDTLDLPTVIRRRSPPLSGPEPALLINLSAYGFLARTEMTVIDGCLVSIELPLVGEIRARSVWSMEDQIGAEFLSPIDPQTYGRILGGLLSA